MNKTLAYRLGISLVGLCGLMLSVRADVESGPKVNTPLETFQFFAHTKGESGELLNRQQDLFATRKDQPTLVVFVHAEKFTRPAAQYLRKLDELVMKVHDDAKIVVVWVHGDVSTMKDYIPKVQTSLKLQQIILGTYEGDQAGPANWNLNQDAAVTTVLLQGRQAKKVWGYDTLNGTDAEAVIRAWKASLGK
jgi:broad specificity phosphatase PhoE